MADIRPAGASVPTPTRPLPVARTEAIKAAQRAFFDQALAGAPARPSAAPAVAASTPSPPMPTRLSFDAAAPAPPGPLRPGSLLDIKV